MASGPAGTDLRALMAAHSEPRPERLVAQVSVELDGRDLTDKLSPWVRSLTIIDGEDQHCTCVLDLDDSDGVLVLPNRAASMTVRLSWPDEGEAARFEGVVESVESLGQRGSGRTLRIMGSATLLLSNQKTQEPYESQEGPKPDKDGGNEGGKDVTLSDELQKRAGKADSSIEVDSTFDEVKRKSWPHPRHMNFLQWAQEMAKQYGANFMVYNTKTEFRDVTKAKDSTVRAVVGEEGNVIAWRIRPHSTRAAWKQAQASYFDQKAGLYKLATAAVKQMGGFVAEAKYTSPFIGDDKDHAKALAEGAARLAQDKAGQGWIVMDGQPSAKQHGKLTAEGLRPGVDGDYRITTVEHAYSRAGWITRCDVSTGLGFPMGDTGGAYGQNTGSGAP